MTSIALRKASPADAPALAALHVAAWRETYTGLVPQEMLAKLSIEARLEMWKEILHKPDECDGTAVFITEHDGGAVGFGSCGRQQDDSLRSAGFSGEFKAIYLLRSHHGRGIGRLIMTAMAGELIGTGHTAASLFVLRDNQLARRFYEKLGGAIVGEKIDERPGGTLVEDAYGWRDLSSLLPPQRRRLQTLS